jgi:UDPglucose 6-dehydrogenase
LRILVVGSGVTGQATGKGFVKYGQKVIFYDIDNNKLQSLKEEGYEVSTSLQSAVQDCDVIFLCVPTPTVDGANDFSFVEDAVIAVSIALEGSNRYCVIALRSTVVPFTTRCKVVPLVEQYSKKKIGEEVGICMNPEFLREKSALKDFLSPDRIVIGEYDAKSGDLLEKTYSAINAPIIRTNLDTAEMIKYASNLFLASKISFFNEMHIIAQKAGVDSSTLSKAVSMDSRIGEYGVYGGRPFDGKCLPKDLAAFRAFVRTLNLNPKLLDAVSYVNYEIAENAKKPDGDD